MIPAIFRIFAAGALIVPAAIIVTTLTVMACEKVYAYLEEREIDGE
jgi:hypothetical protein